MSKTIRSLIVGTFGVGLLAGSLWTLPGLAQQVPTTAVTQSGTWTVDLGATDNAVLDSIADGIAVTNAGTFATQAAQSGTWTVDLGATDNAVLDSIADGIAVTNAGTFAVQVDGSALTALQLIDNIATVDDADYTAGTSTFVPLGGFYQSTVTACTDGDTCAAGITTGRALKVALSDAAGALLSLASDAVFGTDTYTEATSSGPIIGAVRNDTLAALANTDNEIAPLQVDASGALYVKVSDTSLTVDLGANNDVTVTGTVTANLSATDNAVLDDIVDGTLQVQVSGDALTALQLIDNIVGVEDAAETAGGGLAMAGAVVRSTASGSSATAGDNATVNVDTLGRLWARDGNPCADHARITTAAISTSSSGNVQIVALNGSDLIYVCGYSVVAGAATGVQLIYGTGTACATGETDMTGVWSFAANGGITQANGGVPQFVVPAGNAFCVENSGANAIAGHVTYVRTAAP